MPLNANGAGPPSSQPLQAQTTRNLAEPSQGSQASQPTTSPQEIATQLSKPVQEAARSEVVDHRIGRTEITSQMVEQRLTTAAEELSHARAQAARITGEMQAEGLIPSNAPRSEIGNSGADGGPNRTDEVTREKAESAFAQTKEIDATADSPTTSRIV